MATFKVVSELCDVVSYFAYCGEDSSAMLTLENNANEYWIPFSKVTAGGNWQTQISRDLQEMFGSDTIYDGILRLYKIWVPQHTVPCIYHCVYSIKVNGEMKKKSKSAAGRYRGKVRWITEQELFRMHSQNNLVSPELLEFFLMAKSGATKKSTDADPVEYSFCGILVEIGDQALVPANSSSSSIYEQTVDSAQFTREVQCALLRQFLLLSFPAMYMDLQVFTKFSMELGWAKDDCPNLFRAGDVSSRNGLSFRDFLYVLATTEPCTNHGGGPAEVRCRYMFRFYDADKDAHLNYTEFKNLVASVRKSKKLPVDAVNVAKEAEACMKTMGFNPEGHPLVISEFLHAVGELKLRGTSQIFRSAVSVIQYIQDQQGRDVKSSSKVIIKPPSGTDARITKSALMPNITTSSRRITKSNGYELAVHTIRVQKSGTLISIDQIWNIENAVTLSSTNQQTLNEHYRRVSLDQFSQKSTSNEVLKSLRYLTQINKGKANPAKGAKKDIFSWGQLDSAQFARHLISICGQARDLFKDEPRMLDVHSPVYVMGDLHGNFGDLLYFEKVLWHLGPGLCPCTLLFLGDYVDRGQYSVEVISYLLSYKVQSPSKVCLIRGNHEIRDIQKMFTFFAECITKFGDKIGLDVWNAVNSAFDTMPVAAVIDDKVFCCHGGIPPPWMCPLASTINSIPTPLSKPDEQSSLAWELMWNDPIRAKQVTEAMTMELMANEGFALNTRRGTAHVFTVEALEKFLNVNGYSHIIRAHEVAQAGFQVQQKGKLLTVFSSSKYCGGQNEAACILCDQGKLRVMRLETS